MLESSTKAALSQISSTLPVSNNATSHSFTAQLKHFPCRMETMELGLAQYVNLKGHFNCLIADSHSLSAPTFFSLSSATLVMVTKQVNELAFPLCWLLRALPPTLSPPFSEVTIHHGSTLITFNVFEEHYVLRITHSFRLLHSFELHSLITFFCLHFLVA
jgi:hypothetical protein